MAWLLDVGASERCQDFLEPTFWWVATNRAFDGVNGKKE